MNDLSFLVRQVARQPLLYLLIVLILAFGIGMNSAMFTLTDAVLFRDLPVKEPDTLVRIFSSREQHGHINVSSWPAYESLRDEVNGFDGVAAYTDSMPLHVAREDQPAERVNGGVATGNFFHVLGLAPQAGRFFSKDDDHVGAGNAVAVISHHLWRTRFHQSDDVVGKVISINRQPFTVVGVLPASFTGLSVDEHVDVWLPLSMTPVADPDMTEAFIHSPSWSWMDIVGRLAPGVSIDQLQAELDVRAQAEARAMATQQRRQGIGPWRRAVPASQAAVDPWNIMGLERNAMLLTGVVLLVLLLACANVAGLLGVRAEERMREFAVRVSLGATRAHLLSMLLLESALIATAGAVAGLLLARAVLHWVATQAPDGVVLPVDVAEAIVDPRVLLATTILTVLTTLLVGVLPALRAVRVNPAPVLKGGGTTSAERARVSWRDGLVVLQIGISALVLVGAGLLLKSFWNTTRVDPGFDPRGAVMVTLDLSRHGLESHEELAYFGRVQERIAALPGVRAAGYSQTVPVRSGGSVSSVEVSGARNDEGAGNANVFIITPGFLDALGVEMVAGRDLVPADLATDAADVVLVNETMAQQFWPHTNPVGQQVLTLGEHGARIVGVVENHKVHSMREPPPPVMYLPLSENLRGALSLVVRTSREPLTLLAEIRRVVHELDPSLPVLNARTLEEHLAASYSEARLFAWLLGSFAALALLLAAIGLYGMLSHVLRLRRREFGIRIAIGASSRNIAMLILGHVTVLAVLGLAFGLVAALGTAQLLEALLFGVAPLDVATYTGVVLLVVTIAAMASLLPVRRAVKTAPTAELREE